MVSEKRKASEKRKGGERRLRSQQLIERLLEERRQMWVLYERLAGVSPYAGPSPDVGLLNEFVEILVDYIAAAHFGLYERIVNGEERRAGIRSLAEELYPQIASSTDAAVAFNDKYEANHPREMTDELNRDLSSLGEKLAVRIELEDRLIEGLLEHDRRRGG